MNAEQKPESGYAGVSLTQNLVGLGLLLGLAIGVLLDRAIAGAKGKRGAMPQEADQVRIPEVHPSHRPSRYVVGLSAEIYLTLASIIQGITIALLGEVLFNIFTRSTSPVRPVVLLVALDSLMISVLFWFAFVMAFVHLFRIVKLRAKDHWFLTVFYFSAGLGQTVAFQFLAAPRIWLSILLAMIVVLSVYRWYMRSLLRRQRTESKEIRRFDVEHRSLSRILNSLSAVTAILVGLWYVIPSSGDRTYEIVTLVMFTAMLILASVYSVRSFQSRLNVLPPVHSD